MDTVDYGLLFSGTIDYYIADIYNLLIAYLDETTITAFSLTNKFIVSLFDDGFWLSYVRRHKLELLSPLQYWFGSLRQFCLRVRHESYYIVPITLTEIRVFTDIKLAYEYVIDEMATEMKQQSIFDVTKLTKVFNIVVMFVNQWNIIDNAENHVIWSTSASWKSYMNPRLLQYPPLLSNKLVIYEPTAWCASTDIKRNIIPCIVLRSFTAKILQSLTDYFFVSLANSRTVVKKFDAGNTGVFYHERDNDLLILHPAPTVTDKYIVVKVNTSCGWVSTSNKSRFLTPMYLRYHINTLSALETRYKDLGAEHHAFAELYKLLEQ